MNLAINRGIGSNSGPSCLGRGRNVVIQSRVFQRPYSLTNRRKKLGSLSGNLLLSSSLERNTLYLSPNRKLSNPPFKIKCNLDDSLSYTDGNARTIKFEEESESIDEPSKEGNNSNSLELDGLKDLLQKALKELEVAQLNSTMFEEKAQSISETAIALKDKAEKALKDVSFAVSTVQEIMNDEDTAKEAVRKATMSLSLAEARLKVATEALLDPSSSALAGDDESYKKELDECKATLGICEMQLKKVQDKRIELQNEVDRLNEIAENAQMEASRAEEDVSNIMLLAEEAVKLELDAAQRVSDAELAVLKAEKAISLVETAETISSEVQLIIPEEPITGEESPKAIKEELLSEKDEISNSESSNEIDKTTQEETEKISPTPEPEKEIEPEVEKPSKTVPQGKKQESTGGAQKALLKKSSRFLSASFFSSDGKELTWSSLFRGLVSSLKEHAPKLVFVLLLGIGGFFVISRAERNGHLISQPDIVMEEVTTNTEPLVRAIKKFPKRVKQLIDKMPRQELKEGEKSLLDILCLLLASVIFVPAFQKIPGGSPVLGYLAAGVLIGPYGFSIIRHVHGTKEIAEFGVVFLLFNIGLELSVERLSSMKKYVFGLGTAQVFATSIAIGFISHYLCGQPGPAAVVIGTGLALSSTAIVLQLLQERGENTSRHGRATFSVLLFQDLAVVVLLILIPLISPNSSKGGIGFQAIAEALGKSAVKAMLAITLIIAGGRLLLRPIYKQIAENQNAEIFSANTLLVVLGTSLITARAGLSMALGAFLAGLLLAETEFSLQVESDIAPFRGLFLGLFFMTVGMSIDLKVLFSNCPVILSTICALILGKTIIVTLLGKLFGISTMASIRAGLMLAPGGEFAFVAFGDAVKQGLLSSHLSSLLFLVVGLSMALTPWLAAGGQLLSSKFEQHDVRSLIPAESETDDLQDHIIICGFGRVGQIIAQLLSERLIPFVALDVSPDRVALGRAVDLPVYFGDAGSREILHKVGAERACAAAIALDTPGANYRAVWALSKYFPNVKTFVRAHDVVHGLNLEKAGASAVVPETLEPSLQLAAAVLAQAKLPTSEIATAINEFRSRHLSELSELCESSGSSLGYGFSRVMSKDAKPLKIPVLDSDENELVDGALA